MTGEALPGRSAGVDVLADPRLRRGRCGPRAVVGGLAWPGQAVLDSRCRVPQIDHVRPRSLEGGIDHLLSPFGVVGSFLQERASPGVHDSNDGPRLRRVP